WWALNGTRSGRRTPPRWGGRGGERGMGEKIQPSRLRQRETDSLVERGKSQGYVTSDDVLQVVPQPENHLEQVEDMLDVLRGEGVPVVDDGAAPRTPAPNGAAKSPPGPTDGFGRQGAPAAAPETAPESDEANAARLWEEGPSALLADEPEVELDPIADYEHEGI